MPMRHFQKVLVIMGYEVVSLPILLFWAVDGFKSCARMTPTPLRKVFFSFSIVLLLTSPSVFFLNIFGGVVDHAYALGQNNKFR